MRTYYPALLILVLVFCTACSKDKDASNNNEETPTDLISNLSKSPDILLGSWNLIKNISTENSGKTSADCEATNIHFLSDNTFYLKYAADKRIKGKYEIIDSTTVNLFNGTQIIGNASKIEIDENNISLSIEIIDECSDDYTGEKYFRIHQFVWEAMNTYYLWQREVPSLNDENEPGSTKYKEIIAPYPEPEAFFESLKHQEDKYSVIRSNYVDLENSIKGIDASNGVEFILSRYGSGENLLGVVTYILEESDASNKNIKRGDIFIGVDNKDLTLDNYTELLFGENLNYTLNMADLNNNVLSPNGKNIALTKVENFQSNPIQINKIIRTNGIKVGYLMYNQFAQGFDDDLNEAFANFKLERIDELIIDLRYNGGGLTRSALNLAGMITGQFNGEIFAKYLWNQKLMNVFNSDPTNYASYLGENFTQQLADGSAINSLNLNKVYVITSNRSASSSELLINGLTPYINVIQVGDNTYGKNVGGPAALYDYIDNNRTKNPDHTYAVYCMSFYSANSQDFYEYADGLAPQADLKLKEDLTNLGVLGENSEPLLSLALSHITNNAARYKIKTPIFPLENMVDDPQFIKDQLFTSDKKLPLLKLN